MLLQSFSKVGQLLKQQRSEKWKGHLKSYLYHHVNKWTRFFLFLMLKQLNRKQSCHSSVSQFDRTMLEHGCYPSYRDNTLRVYGYCIILFEHLFSLTIFTWSFQVMKKTIMRKNSNREITKYIYLGFHVWI